MGDAFSVPFILSGYNTDCYQRLSLESWFTNLEQTPLNRSQQLPAQYKRLIEKIKLTTRERLENGQFDLQ